MGQTTFDKKLRDDLKKHRPARWQDGYPPWLVAKLIRRVRVRKHSGEKMATLAKEYGVGDATLDRWLRLANDAAAPVKLNGHKPTPKAKALTSSPSYFVLSIVNGAQQVDEFAKQEDALARYGALSACGAEKLELLRPVTVAGTHTAHILEG